MSLALDFRETGLVLVISWQGYRCNIIKMLFGLQDNRRKTTSVTGEICPYRKMGCWAKQDLESNWTDNRERAVLGSSLTPLTWYPDPGSVTGSIWVIWWGIAFCELLLDTLGLKRTHSTLNFTIKAVVRTAFSTTHILQQSVLTVWEMRPVFSFRWSENTRPWWH